MVIFVLQSLELKKKTVMANEFVEKKFPIESLKPKKETGVINFLRKYPEYNGKNVNIAIFDSGVDPQSLGLKVKINLRLCLKKN